MGSAAVVPPPSSAFKRLYYLTSADHAISNIAFGRVKVAELDQLNDPFELLSPRFLNNPTIRSAVRARKEKLAQEYGLVCFSEDWTDPVLWTHYAAKHKGICLGFDVQTGLATNVEYQKERIQAVGSAITKDLETRMLFTKYESWKYEHEWRLPVRLNEAAKEGGLYFEKWGSRLYLAEVVLGPLCTASVDDVRGLVRTHHRDAITYQARLADGSFNIVPRESTIPTSPSYQHVR